MENKPISNEQLLTLTQSLRQYTEGQIISGLEPTAQLNMHISIVKIQKNLTIATVNHGMCMFQYRDQPMVIKLICAILAQFNAGIYVTSDKMSGGDIYEAANMLAEYTHDRIEDIILCLKMVKLNQLGVIYNRLDVAVIMEFWHKYLDHKAHVLEQQYRSNKGPDYRTETDTLLINNARQYETALQKAQRIAIDQRKEIVSLKQQIDQAL